MLYIQKGLDGTLEILIDPNGFSEDGTARFGAFALSKEGKYAGCGISRSGSDWQAFHVMEIAAKKTLSDVLRWIKVSGISWQGGGFRYSLYDEPARIP